MAPWPRVGLGLGLGLGLGGWGWGAGVGVGAEVSNGWMPSADKAEGRVWVGL